MVTSLDLNHLINRQVFRYVVPGANSVILQDFSCQSSLFSQTVLQLGCIIDDS